MTPPSPSTPPFPTAAAAGALTGVSGLCAAAAWAITTAKGAPGPGAAAAGAGVVGLVSVVALVPVAWQAPKGPLPAAQSFMMSLTVRLLLGLSAGLLGVLVFGLPARPFLLALASVYLVVLAVEVAFISRYLSRAYPAPHATPPGGRNPAPPVGPGGPPPPAEPR